MSAVDLTPQTTDPDLDDESHHTHIVKTPGGMTAHAHVMQARIEGTMVEALCGHRWVPQRDPSAYPICPACKEIHDLYKMGNPNLNDPKG